MDISEARPQSLNIVLLYDLVNVKTIPLDPIKVSTSFNVITLMPENVMGGVLALASDSPKAKVTIQSTRLEYISEEDIPFQQRSLEELWKLLGVIPSFSIKAYGINFFYALSTRHEKGSGCFVLEQYIKDPASLARILNQPLLSASVRLLLGTPDHYRDLRITPSDLASKELVFQYHLHRDIPVSATEKLKHIIEDSVKDSATECNDLLRQLP